MSGHFRALIAEAIIIPITAAVCLALLAGSALRADAEEAKKELTIGKWYPSLEAGLALTQGTYSDNWAGGDKGSIVWTLIANSTLENQLDPKANWKNTLKLAFGQTHQQKDSAVGSRYWESPEKSTDLVDLESLLRLTLGGFVDPFASVAYQSQFQDATDAAGRRLAFNPMLFKESAGIARQFLRTEDRELLSRLGLALRQSIRRTFTAPPPATGTESSTTNDGGLEWVTDHKSKIMQKRIVWTSKLTVYQPFYFSGKKDLDDLSAAYLISQQIDPDVAALSTRISADWENIWTSQITKVVSVSLYTRWIYDAYDNSVKPVRTPAGELADPGAVRAAIRKGGQFKETLSIGLTYRFL